MSVGFGCWWVVVNSPDEGASNEVWWSLLTTSCFGLPSEGKAQKRFGSVEFCVETFGGRLLKIYCICRTEGLHCIRELIKINTKVGYVNKNEAEEERVCSGDGRVSEGSTEKSKQLDTVQLVLLINTFRSPCCSDIFTADFTHTIKAFAH